MILSFYDSVSQLVEFYTCNRIVLDNKRTKRGGGGGEGGEAVRHLE